MRLKIAIVGPKMAGKTVLANALADRPPSASKTYEPTQGARIVVIENEGAVGKSSSNATIELWDVSGDTQYEACWPAIADGLHGLLLVFNVDEEGQENELEIWVRKFIKVAGLRSSQVLILANKTKFASQAPRQVELPKYLQKPKMIHSNLETDAEAVVSAFRSFLAEAKVEAVARRDQQENMVMSRRSE
eukprot:m.208218 g.208218  ORF g.208218 m.208218 type:complete len:190 (+) comp17798_c1_seq1:6313-6882(+)